MKNEIRHRRLHAFYKSKVLNALMMVVMLCLMLLAYTKSMLLPVVSGSIAFALFIGYAIWFWIKKPKSIIINNWLSDFNGWSMIYYLILVAMNLSNPWWYITYMIFAIIILFLAMTNNQDQKFDI